MGDKILCKRCEPTKTRTDYWVKEKTEKGKCNRCFEKIEKDE